MAKLRGAATRKGMAEIGRRLAQIRREQGFSQKNMARRLGVSQPVYSDYERGNFRLHAELLRHLAKILKSSADELVGVQPRRSPSRITDRRFVRRFQKIDRLSRQDKDALLRTIDAFLGNANV